MNRKLPSLLAVRYFESVGRHLSFTLAAHELNVTQAAVSHQVKQLEEKIGTQLLTRLHQRVELTPEGEALLKTSIECLDMLAETFDSISSSKSNRRVVLSVTPLLSAHWLLPRLNRYLADHTSADIVLHNSLKTPTKDTDDFDLKIFYSAEQLNDSNYDPLLTDELLPICNASMTQGIIPLPLSEFSKFNLVHEFDHSWWEAWCELANIDPFLAHRGMVVDDPVVLEKAALVGHGLVLGSASFMRDRIESGELITPFGLSPTFKIHYYLYTKPTARGKAISDLREWIISEFQQSQN